MMTEETKAKIEQILILVAGFSILAIIIIGGIKYG